MCLTDLQDSGWKPVISLGIWDTIMKGLWLNFTLWNQFHSTWWRPMQSTNIEESEQFQQEKTSSPHLRLLTREKKEGDIEGKQESKRKHKEYRG